MPNTHSGDDAAHLFVFTAEKAGMKDANQSRANQIIYEMSKNSRFFKNAQRNDVKTQNKIETMKERVKGLRPGELKGVVCRVDRRVNEMECKRDLSRTWVVVDMDMFFAAVEMVDRPELRGKPIAVGGMSMISTANYEARKYGVRSAMPGFIAVKLCPDLVFVRSNFARYRQVADQTRQVFALYDPDFRAASLDEAYLDLTNYLDQVCCDGSYIRYIRPNTYTAIDARTSTHTLPFTAPRSPRDDASFSDDSGSIDSDGAYPRPSVATKTGSIDRRLRDEIAEQIVAEMRARITRETKLTCSAGIAPLPMLAKVCSDVNKPNGQKLLPGSRQDVLDFTRAMKIRKVPGIGKVTERILNEGLGIATVMDLWLARYKIPLLFSEKSTDFFLRVSLAATSSVKVWESSSSDASNPGALSRKSMSCERTFRDNGDDTWIKAKLRELCQSLSESVRKEDGLAGGHTITLKLKLANFEVKSRAMTVSEIVGADPDQLYEYGVQILRKELPIRLRLMGLRLSTLVPSKKRKQREDAGAYSIKTLLGGARAPVQGEEEGSAGVNDIGKKEQVDVGEVCRNSMVDGARQSAGRMLSKGTSVHQSNIPIKTYQRYAPTTTHQSDVPSKTHQRHAPNTTHPSKTFPVVSKPSPVKPKNRLSFPNHHQDVRQSTPSSPKVRPSNQPSPQAESDHLVPPTITTTCPVCQANVLAEPDSQAFNSHIDSCLNTQYIDQQLQLSSQHTGQPRPPPGRPKVNILKYFQQ